MRKITCVLLLASLAAAGCAAISPGGGDSTTETTPSRANAPSDDAITSAIKDSMRKDDLLATTSVDVTTQQGVVTLKGRLPNARAANRAFSLARSTEGVRRVISNLDWPSQ